MEIAGLTPERKEMLKSKDWRINHLYKIKDKNAKLIRFKLNDAQRDFAAKAHNRNIILKSRQLGFTTFECIDILDDALWIPNYDALLLSYDEPSALDIFDNKVELAWDHYPDMLKSLLLVDTKRANKLKFDFGRNIFSSFSVKTRGRSGTYRRLHVSELGKISKESPRKAKEIVAGTIPAIPIDGRVDIESTAEGEFGYFPDIFWEAWLRGNPENSSQFKAHFYNWQWDKEELRKVTHVIPFSQMDNSSFFKEAKARYNLTDIEITYYYLKYTSLNRDIDILHQEYPITPEEAFVASGKKVFSAETILRHQDLYGEDGVAKGNWKIYEEPLAGHFYTIGGDTSEGIGKDANSAVVWDITLRPKVVATYNNNKISPTNFAFELKHYAEKYNRAYVGVERNNTGHTTIAKLREIYDNDKIYKEIKYDKEEEQETERYGWHTNLATKPKMIYDMVSVMNEGFVVVPDKQLLLQMRTYDQEDLQKTKAEEDQIMHWDMLMAACIGFQMKHFMDIAGLKGGVKTVKSIHSYSNLSSGI